MVQFLALLLLAPCLAVLGWLYWLYARRGANNGIAARFDAGVLVAAVVIAIICCAIAWRLTIGHAGPIWKQVATPLATYAGFNIVLLVGLLRHWFTAGHPETRPAPESSRTP